jgi:MurNAc alpha-1-phosphate uridylyltransferase
LYPVLWLIPKKNGVDFNPLASLVERLYARRMKAMIFAAGIGSRLKQYTQNTPKCLMPLGDTTILERVVTRLKGVGVSEVVINIHHHPEQVIEHVRSRGDFGIKVHLSHEPTLLNTGGGLKKVRDIFRGERAFFVHNADIHYTGDLASLLDAHHRRSTVATLGIMNITLDSGLFFDSEQRLVGWTGSTPCASDQAKLYSFSGISVCSEELFSYMDEAEKFSIIEPFIAAARSTGRVFGAEIDHLSWVDIGTPERLEALRQSLKG